MENGNSFLNKHCKVILKNGFVLFGVVTELTPAYIFLVTSQKSSLLSFIDIKSVELDPQYYGGKA